MTLAARAGGAGAEPRASLPDIEDEVMCLECGTALNVSNSAVADQEREFIAELIAQGKTKREVKEALVAEYGPRVLAEPDDEGFGLAAWLVPLLARGSSRSGSWGRRPPLAPRADRPPRSAGTAARARRRAPARRGAGGFDR